MKYEILFGFIVLFLVFVLPDMFKILERIYRPNPSNCDNVSQHDYSITEICRHPESDRITRVLESAAGCETTYVECSACGAQLTKPKTEC